jgi:phosphoribosylformimino-5-aminoimidazole carboxamide ribotide isomerase
MDEGATHLHTVDLDGAKTGSCVNFSIIEKIANLGLIIQTGGGIRDISRFKMCLDAGVSRVILGSAAVTDRDFLVQALTDFAGHTIVGIDMLDNYVRTSGWIDNAMIDYLSFARDIVKLGTKTIIFTDISRDGTLQGISSEPVQKLRNALPDVELIVAGGVRNLNDIDLLLDLKIDGAICGKSLYSGTLVLADAINRCKHAR